MREILNPTPTFIGKMEEKRRVIHMRIKLGNKTYKLREGAQCVYEALAMLGLILVSYGIFYKLCELIVFIAKEVR
jgi:hypothetical protein